MFTLEMLTKQPPAAPAEPEEAPAVSLPNVFVPVLAAPVVEEKRPRVRGWVFVAAFVALVAPIVAVVATHETKTATPKRVANVTTEAAGTITETSEKTESAPTARATQAAPNEAPCMCMPPPRPKPIATATATVKPVKHEAPKCCPGESEMQCAMRRSVGATCG